MAWANSHPVPRLLTLSACTVLLSLAGCGSGDAELPEAQIRGQQARASSEGSGTPAYGGIRAGEAAAAAAPRSPQRPPVVEIQTSLGTITLRLFADQAPETVQNFLVNYVDRGFYEQTIVHHAEPEFMVAAGGYTADLQAKPTRAWIRNESSNGLSNRRGTVAMARPPEYPHSATSQFFINLADNAWLDYQDQGEDGEPVEGYCVFGEVTQGMEIVEQMAAVEVRETEEFPRVPVTPIVVISARRVD